MKNFKVRFKIQSDLSYLPFLTRLGKGLKVNPPHRLAQILVEAYSNAVIHGHKRKKAKWIEIGLDSFPKKVCLQVVDQGPGIQKGDWQRPARRWARGGRGLAMIRAYADAVASTKKSGGHCFQAICFLKS